MCLSLAAIFIEFGSPVNIHHREIKQMANGFKTKQKQLVDLSQTENVEPSNKDSTNPFDFLYQSNDCEVSKNPAISNTFDYVYDLSEEISGNYDFEYRLRDINYDHLSYVRIGANYKKAQILGLHTKKGYDRFKDFCPKFLGKSYSHVRKLQEASKVACELIMAGFHILPQNASQAHELRHYTGVALIKKWEQIINHLKPHQITQKAIQTLLGKDPSIRHSKDRRVTLTINTHLLLEAFADEQNTSISNVIEYLVRYTIESLPKKKQKKVSKKQMQIWQEDLQELVQFYHQTQVEFPNNR